MLVSLLPIIHEHGDHPTLPTWLIRRQRDTQLRCLPCIYLRGLLLQCSQWTHPLEHFGSKRVSSRGGRGPLVPSPCPQPLSISAERPLPRA